MVLALEGMHRFRRAGVGDLVVPAVLPPPPDGAAVEQPGRVQRTEQAMSRGSADRQQYCYLRRVQHAMFGNEHERPLVLLGDRSHVGHLRCSSVTAHPTKGSGRALQRDRCSRSQPNG